MVKLVLKSKISLNLTKNIIFNIKIIVRKRNIYAYMTKNFILY